MLDAEETITRVAHGMATENKGDAYLILNSELGLGRQQSAPELTFERIKRFPHAMIGDETYVIYRVRAATAKGPEE